MKKIILSAVLGLMSAVSFAQTVAPVAPAHHTREEHKVAREACKTSVGQFTDKKAHHEAMVQCMEGKGFHRHSHPMTPSGQAGEQHPSMQ